MSDTCFLSPAGFRLVHLDRHGDSLIAHLTAISTTVACPSCGLASGRIHSRYRRRFAELPSQGRPVRLLLAVRRFRCPTPDCPRRIFTERLPGLTAPRARGTISLRHAHSAIGQALGGEAGARLGMPTSPDSLLRRLRQEPRDPPPPPRVLGVDDFAFRKGSRYGTILVDLESRRAVDLLPDREAATVATWLRARPGVEVVARDRANAYAQAAAEAVPDAVQVADRWHLLKNVRETLQRALQQRSQAIRRLLGGPTTRRPRRWRAP